MKLKHLVAGVLLVGAVVAVSLWYRKPTLAEFIVDQVRRECPEVSSPCVLNLKKTGWMDWGEMYVFRAGFSFEDISHELQQGIKPTEIGRHLDPDKLPFASVESQKVMFLIVPSRRTIHAEEFTPEGKVSFRFDEGINLLQISKMSSRDVFMPVERIQTPNGMHYVVIITNAPVTPPTPTAPPPATPPR